MEVVNDQIWVLEPVHKADVIWIDQKDKEYKLHSVVLSRQSPVFCQMYKHETYSCHRMDYSTTTLKVVISLMYDLQLDKSQMKENILMVWEFTHRYECKLEQFVVQFIISNCFDNLSYCTLFKFALIIQNQEIRDYIIDRFLSSNLLLLDYFKYEIDQELKTHNYKFRMDSQIKITQKDPFCIVPEVAVFRKNNKHDVFWTDSENCDYCLHSAILQNVSLVFQDLYKKEQIFYNLVNFPTIPLLCFCELIYNQKIDPELSDSILIEVFDICVYFKYVLDIVWDEIHSRMVANLFSSEIWFKLAQLVLHSQNMTYIGHLCNEIQYYKNRNALLELFDLPILNNIFPQVEEVD